MLLDALPLFREALLLCLRRLYHGSQACARLRVFNPSPPHSDVCARLDTDATLAEAQTCFVFCDTQYTLDGRSTR